jgi:hypothetical protein
MWWACPEGGEIRFVPEAARQLEHSSDHGQTAYNSQCSCAAMIPTQVSPVVVAGAGGAAGGGGVSLCPRRPPPQHAPGQSSDLGVETQLLLHGCCMGHQGTGYAAACERLAHTVVATGLFLRRPGCRGPPQIVVKPCTSVNAAVLQQCLGHRGAMWCCGGGNRCRRWWWVSLCLRRPPPQHAPGQS